MSEMNENKSLSCAVARDLMPLYVENLTEDETTEMMRAHIASCAACAQSYGMQKTKLEIEKKPRHPDFGAIRFFKKSYLKRVALWMAVAIMGCMILVGGGNYLFSDCMIAVDQIKLVGQYELSDGRIVLAMQAEDYCVNNLKYYCDSYVDHSMYEYSGGYRQVREDNQVLVNGSVNFITDRWYTWTRKADERGDVFYYMFDPAVQEDNNALQPFATPAPTALITDGQAENTQENEKMPVLQYVRVNGERLIWRMGDPLRKLTAEEEEVLLRAMEKAGFLDGAEVLPETDILDALMEK